MASQRVRLAVREVSGAACRRMSASKSLTNAKPGPRCCECRGALTCAVPVTNGRQHGRAQECLSRRSPVWILRCLLGMPAIRSNGPLPGCARGSTTSLSARTKHQQSARSSIAVPEPSGCYTRLRVPTKPCKHPSPPALPISDQACCACDGGNGAEMARATNRHSGDRRGLYFCASRSLSTSFTSALRNGNHHRFFRVSESFG